MSTPQLHTKDSAGPAARKLQTAAHTKVTRSVQADDRMLLLLDIEKFMTGAHMALVESAVH